MAKEQVVYISRAQKIENARRDCIGQLHSSPYVKSQKGKDDTDQSNKGIHFKSLLLFQFICAIVIFLFVFSSQKLGIKYDGFNSAYLKEKIQENKKLERLEETFYEYTEKLQIDKDIFLH